MIATPQVKTNPKKLLKRVPPNLKSKHLPKSTGNQPRPVNPRKAPDRVTAKPRKVQHSTRRRYRPRAWRKLPRASGHWSMPTTKNGRRSTRRQWLATRHG